MHGRDQRKFKGRINDGFIEWQCVFPVGCPVGVIAWSAANIDYIAFRIHIARLKPNILNIIIGYATIAIINATGNYGIFDGWLFILAMQSNYYGNIFPIGSVGRDHQAAAFDIVVIAESFGIAVHHHGHFGRLAEGLYR